MTSGERANSLRRWCLRPAPHHDAVAGEPFTGWSILREVPGPLGVLLWQSLRDALLWAATPVNSRGALFSSSARARRAELLAAAKPDERLGSALRLLETLIGSTSSGDAEVTGAAAGQVVSWAVSRDHPQTALAFAHAAAAVLPSSAAAALRAGHRAHAAGYQHLAEIWYRRTISLARTRREWVPYASALVGLGRVYADRDPAAARVYFLKALRACRRVGAGATRAHAFHGLFRLAAAAGDHVLADGLASKALRRFGPHHPGRSELLQDVAEYRLQQGDSRVAMRILQDLLEVRTRTPERMRTLVALVRAAARVGDRPVLESAWFSAMALIGRLGETEDGARCNLDLARAAVDAGECARAAEVALRAFQLSQRLDRRQLCREAEEVLDQTRAGRPPVSTIRESHPAAQGSGRVS
jgi:hypothetical protein